MPFEDSLGRLAKGNADLHASIELFNSANSPQRALSLFSAAAALRDERVGREIKLHGHLGMVTTCPIDPPCLYCSVSSTSPALLSERRALSIVKIREYVSLMERSGMGAVHLVGGTSLSGLDDRVREVVSAIREDTDIPLEIAVGPSLSLETVRWLKMMGVFRIVCSLETLNAAAFAEAKPGDSLEKRIAFMRMLEEEGVQLKSIVMNGLGSTDDLIESIFYLNRFDNLTSLSISTFTPIEGTPWAKRSPASAWDSLKAMAIARLLFPDAEVGLAFGGGGNLMPMTLMAGGGNTFMGMLMDNAKHVDNRASIASCASSFGFEVRPGAV